MNALWVLGAGVTGLAAGLATRWPVLEQNDHPGGICASYYMRATERRRLNRRPEDGSAYRFELGGGHWLFGGDATVIRFISAQGPVRRYHRRAAVYFARSQRLVPFPLQNHLSHLGELGRQAAQEILSSPGDRRPSTMADWLEHHFGKTLTDHFFGPFHERYTAGWWTEIAPQDAYKSPLDRRQVERGLEGRGATVGYNTTFLYPEHGLDALAYAMAHRNTVEYGRRIVGIEPHRKRIMLADGTSRAYDTVLATLPLNRLTALADQKLESQPDPSTAVLVLNIGGIRGPRCPAEHWLYVPDSLSGFFRVGFYSNVTTDFLPDDKETERVSLYVERAFRDGERPSEAAVRAYTTSVVEELIAWGFLDRVEVVDPTWIDVAYTWTRPGSTWRRDALAALETAGIFPVGRYARWSFQGIADSIRDGLSAGTALRSNG